MSTCRMLDRVPARESGREPGRRALTPSSCRGNGAQAALPRLERVSKREVFGALRADEERPRLHPQSATLEPMASIYLINPRADFPTYYGAEVYAGRGYEPAAFLADLVVPTLAAMIPKDFEVKICDEHLEPVDFNAAVDYVGITGKISQWGRMKAIAREFRRRGVIVIMGGPHASLSPEVTRPHCDILVRDEIEEIADELWSDLRSGRFREEYVGGRPDLRTFADAALGPLRQVQQPRAHRHGADRPRLPLRVRVLRRDPVRRPQAAPQAHPAHPDRARHGLRERLPQRAVRRRQHHRLAALGSRSCSTACATGTTGARRRSPSAPSSRWTRRGTTTCCSSPPSRA